MRILGREKNPLEQPGKSKDSFPRLPLKADILPDDQIGGHRLLPFWIFPIIQPSWKGATHLEALRCGDGGIFLDRFPPPS